MCSDQSKPRLPSSVSSSEESSQGIMIDRSTLFLPTQRSTQLSMAKDTTATPLARELHQLILARGPISVAEFMRQALCHPVHGYYTCKESVFGKAGDFTTAPEISQVFGELLGIWCVATWQQMGQPEAVRVVEIGPGRGTLMADMLRTFNKFPAFSAAATCHLVEISSNLKEVQRQALSKVAAETNSAMAANVSWHEQFVDVVRPQVYGEDTGADEGPILVLGQELLDALPIHQLQYTRERGWCERLVDVNLAAEQKGDFRFVLSPGPTPATAFTARKQKDSEGTDSWDYGVGDTLEVCPAACALAQDIALALQKQGGAALFVDYGADFAAADSLRGIFEHAFCDVLHRPGEVDLSADVDFAAIRRSVECLPAWEEGRAIPDVGNASSGDVSSEANRRGDDDSKSNGVLVHGPIDQSELLQRLGIGARFNMLLQNATSDEQAAQLEEDFKRLTDPSEMGRVYKAFSISSEPLGVPAGFG